MLAGMVVLQMGWCGSLTQAAEWKLSEKATLQTATEAEGQEALSKFDLFIKSMSPFDLAVRLGTNEPTSPRDYVRQTMAQVEDFTAEDEEHLQAAMDMLLPKLAKWKLPWPHKVLLVKTSAEHESGAAYCRGPVIVLPASRITPDKTKLAKLLAHELFHVLSNQNPMLRQELYRLLGFSYGGMLNLPKSWNDRRITNPDAPLLIDYVKLKIGDREVAVVPFLFAESQYDPMLKQGLFDYMEFRLMEIELTLRGMRPVLDEKKQPVLHRVSEVPDYMEKVGSNTNYIIHPEEVLAENFVLLVFEKKDVPTPELLEKMTGVLGD